MLSEAKEKIRKNKLKINLLIFNLIISFVAIFFFHLGILPLKKIGDLLFFLFITLTFSLYRPGWAFLFFVGSLFLENISLTPSELGFSLRIYQALALMIILTILIRSSLRRLSFNLPFLVRQDYWVFFILLGGFLSALFSPEKLPSFKLFLVLLSFSAIYFLTRTYVRDREDLKRVVIFFLSSTGILVFYGILQNIFFLEGFSFHKETMPGRPNATLMEPDWLGICLVFSLALVYSLIFYFWNKGKKQNNKLFPSFSLLSFSLILFLVPLFTLLVLTVSRSAWLGAFFVSGAFFFLTLTQLKLNPKNWQWLKSGIVLGMITSTFLLSLFLVFLFSLTNFQLFNRFQSATSGLQKITISCSTWMSLPERIDKNEELEKFSCRQINLEEIDEKKASGNFVTEIYRTDQNVNIRKQLFQKSWEEIRRSPFLGLGFGGIAPVLGKDERGLNFNSSNIFLETWLGAGILGLIGLLGLYFEAIYIAAKNFLNTNLEEKTFGLFVFLGTLAFLIPNFFNAGIFLAVFWFFWALLPLSFRKND